MTAEVKLTGKPQAQRIADRLRNSGDGSNPNEHTVHGSGPTRVHHNIHHSGHFVQPGTQAKSTDGRVADNPDAKTQGSGGNP
jgi:hypothetical protein